MGKTSCKKGQYYCNTDKRCKPIPDGYEVREDGFLVKEGWSDKYKKSIDCDNPKGFSQKAHCAGKKKKMTEESNPRIARKKGQPAKSKKHSDLYTDEDPKGTIHGLGFKDVATAKASVAKIRKSSRSHAHKIQAAIAMEQRARVMGKTAEAAVYRKFINSMKKKTKAMNEEKHGDHEYEMIRRQTDNIMVAAKKLKKKFGKGEGNVKAWVQSKITKAADYLDTAADYETGKEEVKEGSLHKWFKGSKSKDGKGGWVNVVTGGTCASDEPGEGTPKCVSSAKRASMSKKERLSAARRKKKADPNQQSKRGAAKPTYVSTDKPKKKKKMKEEFISLPLQLEVPQSEGEFKLGMMFRESLEQDRGMLFIFENTDYHSFHMKNTFIPLDIAFINEEGVIESIKELDPMNPIPVYPDGDIRYAIEVNRGWFAENGVEVGDIILEDTDETEIDLTEVKDKKGKGSGTKDACYHKVKSRYSVWPSAYASGALVKCRKVGAANWGNSRKEEVEYEVNEGLGSAIKKGLKATKKVIKNIGDDVPNPFDNSIKGRIRNTMYDLRQQKKLGQKAAVSAGGIGVGVGGGKLMHDSTKKEEVEYEVNEGVKKIVKTAIKAGDLIKQGVRKAGQAGGSIKPKKGFYNVKSGPNKKPVFTPKDESGYLGYDMKMVRPAGGGSRRVKASYGKKPEKSLTQRMKDKLQAQKDSKKIKPDKFKDKGFDIQRVQGGGGTTIQRVNKFGVQPGIEPGTQAVKQTGKLKIDPTKGKKPTKRTSFQDKDFKPKFEHYDWRNEINIDEGAAGALKLGGMITRKIPSAVKAIGAGVATGASLLGIKKKDDESIIKPNDKLLKKKKGEDSPFKLKKGRTQSELDPTPEQKKANQEQEKMNKKLGYTEQFSDWRQELEEKCWPGYEKKGMKTMFGKRYPNCVKKSKKKK